MTLFRNDTHSELWRQRWCHTCFQPDEAARRIQGKDTQCPIWAKAIGSGRKPPEWSRNTRADEMVKTIRCNAYQDQPPVNRRGVSDQVTEPLFDVTPYAAEHPGYLPVDGDWPEKPTKNEVDHQ
jgi:hypothetical protein